MWKPHLAVRSYAHGELANSITGMYFAVVDQHTYGLPDQNSWYPEQHLGVWGLTEGLTNEAAYVGSSHNRVFHQAQGYLADLIILEKDPFICNPEEM